MNKPREAAVVEARAEAIATPGITTAQAHAPGVGVPHPHESAHLHVAGEATYVDDMPELAGTLHAALGLSPVAHGRLTALSLDTIAALPGVVDVFSASDIPGRNDCGPIVHDDPILADGTVQYLGQPVFVVLARLTIAAMPPNTNRASATRSPSSRRRKAPNTAEMSLSKRLEIL